MLQVQSYEEAFAKIQAATGISDIDELVTTFINAEDQNFALFNYVNELNSECKKLEEQALNNLHCMCPRSVSLLGFRSCSEARRVSFQPH